MAKYSLASLVAATAAMTLVAPSLSAAERHKNVEYSDLDLSTQAGQAKLKSRIVRAVRNVCIYPEAKTLQERRDQQQCEARAKNNAMTKAAQTIARNGGSAKVALD